nr:immunoglobulin heavy chain junction region [Macaca mulatta]MOV49257.1 immunoglobulin heavy chain junction region [Macaca mulatta]MOV49389.1 immunoglobulin heavy chain junction region [Macaca mulatta]MOV49482.1 immunoglobulin heavy chain junction region [Macaca mulatta]MOV49932.1 immunoglobulin heavy chain junction region [Macaca mulatta]
CTRKQANFDFW